MMAVWLLGGVLFWVGYFRFTRGAVTRHVAFLHFAIYFFAIYLASYSLFVESGASNYRFLLSVVFHPVLALAGMVVASVVWRHKTIETRDPRASSEERRLALAIVIGFLVIYVVYLRSLDEVPLFGVLMGGDLQASRLARYLATKGYSGEGLGGLRLFYWVPRLFIDYFAEFVVVFAFYWWRTGRSSVHAFVWTTIVVVILSLLQVEKYPAMKIAVILGLCMFNYRYDRIRLRTLAVGAGLVTGGVAFMGLVFGLVAGGFRGTAGVGSAAATTIELGAHILSTRGMVGQAIPLRVTYEIIPHYFDYFGGRTLTNPHDLLPYKKITLPFVISDTYWTYETGVQGSDPTAFFGEVYANWGLTVSWLSMFAFGFIVQVVGSTLARRVNDGTIWDMAFYYLIMLYVGDFAISFSTLYFDERIYFFVGLIVLRNWLTPRRETALAAPPLGHGSPLPIRALPARPA